MNQRMLSACIHADTDKPLCFEALASISSLITNPHTSDSSISSALQTLTRYLQLTPELDSLSSSHHRHHALKLLTDLAANRPDLSPLIYDAVRSSVPHSSPRLAAESLLALASISESNETVSSGIDDPAVFLSLCFSPDVSLRLRLLRNAERLRVRPHVLVTVFLGFMKDPYPYVREAALDGLVCLCKHDGFDDRGVIEACYYGAVELLCDREDCVRAAAVGVVSEWGLMLMATSGENYKSKQSDEVFLELCSMVRDMSVGVRIKAFDALGKIRLVSEDILLQTLSKKVLGITKVKKPTGEGSEMLLSSAAGVFIHGLEDEFHDVRKSACHSLRKLTVLSSEFAAQALNLLMDVLNDDSTIVRLEVLETLNHMATFECLKVQEVHMHMFLGTLIDTDDLVRSAARKIFNLIKLPSLELFRLSINGLLENLKFYPQDEAGVLAALFHVGRSHSVFTTSFIKQVSEEIEPVCEGKLNLDSPRVAAFLVLSIAAGFPHHRDGQCIPQRLYSYAVTHLGKLSHALNGIVDQDALLMYLCQHSRSSSSSGTEVEGEEMLLAAMDEDVPDRNSMLASSPAGKPLLPINSKIIFPSLLPCGSLDVAIPVLAEYQLEANDEVGQYVHIILEKVESAWLLLQLRCIKDALQTLRACKVELSTFTPKSIESSGALAFRLGYIRVIKLLMMAWEQIVWKVQSSGLGEVEILLGKLDSKLQEMRCRFIGFSNEEDLHVLELVLVACALRLCKAEICCHLTTIKRLSATMSSIEFLSKDKSIALPTFVLVVKKALYGIGDSSFGTSCSPGRFRGLVDKFSLRRFNFHGALRYISAELRVMYGDFENPLRFVPGLPVALTLDIILKNVQREHRLWVRIKMNEKVVQFVYLDLNLIEAWEEGRKFTFNAPFYRIPKMSSFRLKVCIGMECSFEDVDSIRCRGGPKRPLVGLCPEKDVYLRMV